MLGKRTVLDHVDIHPDGLIFIRFAKQSASGAFEDWHRTSLSPGDDVDSQMGAVSASLEEMGYGPVSQSEVNAIKSVTSKIWTNAIVEAYNASKE